MQIPPWIQAANPAAQTAQGFSLGMQAGAQQAAERFRQQQTQRAEQEDALRQAQWEAEFHLQSAAAARKASAMQNYQSRVGAGEDPLKVMMELGPMMGESGSAMAAAERRIGATPKTPVPMPSVQTTPKGSEYMVDPNGRVIFAPVTRQPGLSGAATPKATVPMPSVQTTPKGSEYMVDPNGRVIFAPVTRQPGLSGAANPNTKGAMTDYQKAQLAVATKKARASSLLAQMNAEPNAAKKREIAKQIQEIWPPPATPGPLDQNPFNPDDMLAAVEGVAGAAGAVPTGDATSPSIAAPTISPSSQIPTVKSQEERDALPPGTVYVGPDGKKYRKQ